MTLPHARDAERAKPAVHVRRARPDEAELHLAVLRGQTRRGGSDDGRGMSPSPIRVLLVDDQPLARSGLRMILCPEEGFVVAGECSDGAEVLEAVARLRPELVVMDVRMRQVDGAEATRRLAALAQSPPVLILTTFNDDEVLSAALRAGAAGFLLKDAPGEEILRAARVVAAGDAYLDPAVTGRVLTAYRGTAPPDASATARLHELTERELEVLRLIGRGASNTEIAEQLVIGEGTVKTHISRIFDKLELRDRAAAIVFTFDHGLVQPQR
jgi:DNA-binding NarL/FixJ family response regulator